MQLEDIVTSSLRPETHIMSLRIDLGLLKQRGSWASSKKCTSFTDKTDYLRQFIYLSRLEIISPRNDVIYRLENSPRVTALKLFSAFASFPGCSFPNVTLIAEPLNKKLRKGELWVWIEQRIDELIALDNLKTLSSYSVLVLSRHTSIWPCIQTQAACRLHVYWCKSKCTDVINCWNIADDHWR